MSLSLILESRLQDALGMCSGRNDRTDVLHGWEWKIVDVVPLRALLT